MIDALIARGADVGATDSVHKSVFHYAVQSPNARAVLEYLARHPLIEPELEEFVNSVDSNGDTPLHLCAQHAKWDLLTPLLKHRADRTLPLCSRVAPP